VTLTSKVASSAAVVTLAKWGQPNKGLGGIKSALESRLRDNPTLAKGKVKVPTCAIVTPHHIVGVAPR
jgi:hypothetical protein